ncbi:WGxxGxxG family protein [Deinococcus altitudinis]|uniref:WGxxGxxG family protein n=1 Tax=Deinococcus altitudinis TaxID=468914 RepID=UPI003892349D
MNIRVLHHHKENTMSIIKKTALVLALALAPISAYAQTTDTTTTPTTTDTTSTGTTNTGTTDNTNDDNDNSNWGWLGLLGLAGLAGLRRQPVTVVPERTMTGTGNNRP